MEATGGPTGGVRRWAGSPRPHCCRDEASGGCRVGSGITYSDDARAAGEDGGAGRSAVGTAAGADGDENEDDAEAWVAARAAAARPGTKSWAPSGVSSG